MSSRTERIRLVTLAISLFVPTLVLPQFNYVGVNVGYGTIGFGGGFLEKNAHSQFHITLSGFTRPVRNFGLGVHYRQPIQQNTKFNFSKSQTTGGYFSDFSYSGRFTPSTYDYELIRGPSLSIIGRIFMDVAVNSYVDARVSIGSTTERFDLRRNSKPAEYSYGYLDEAEVPAVNIAHRQVYRHVSPGFHFGIMPHLSDHLYFDLSVGVDLVSFKERGFSQRVEFDWSYSNDEYYYVTLNSPAQGTRASFLIDLGLGYYF